MPFTGRAIYDDFTAIHEDLSDLVSLLAPFETPLLDILGTSERPAMNTLHEWLDVGLNPHTDTTSGVIGSGDQTVLQVVNSGRFQTGDLIMMDNPNNHGREVMLVNSVLTGTLDVTRAYGGTTAITSLGAGRTVDILGRSNFEGDETVTDRSVAKTRRTNYTQIFKAEVYESGTAAAVNYAGGSQFERDKTDRLRELLRSLEKTILFGVTANSIGTDSARRSLAGIVNSISTNVQSWGTFTESGLNNMLELAYNQGSKNIDILVLSPTAKRVMSTLNASRINIIQDTANAREDWLRSLVSVYEGDFGRQQVIMSRYLAEGNLQAIGLDSSRVKPTPLVGRSFQYEDLSKIGDSRRGQILGEYTVELRNENAHCLMTGP